MKKQLEITIEDLSIIKPELFVELRRDKINFIKNSIREKFGSIRKFSKHINCFHLVSKLIFIQRPSITQALKISSSLGLKTTEIIEKVVSRSRKIRCFVPVNIFPIKSSKELASLFGHSFGDGHIGVNCFTFTNKSEELLQEVQDNIIKIGFCEVSMNSKTHKATTIGFPKVIRDVLIAAGAPVGNKITQSFIFPLWIKNGNKETRQSFVRALFDDEGSVKVNSREILLKFSKADNLQKNFIDFLEEIKQILHDFEIDGVTITKDLVHEGKNGKTTQRVLRVCGIKSFINFQKFIGFFHPQKTEQLKGMISRTQKIKLRDGEGETKILTLFRRKNINTNQVAKALNITKLAAWKQLSKLEKKGLIKKFKPKNNKFNSNLWMISNDSFNCSELS